MSKKNKIAIFFFFLFLIGGLSFYFGFYNRSYKNIDNISAEVEVSSSELVSSFMMNEKYANSVYRGKIIEVVGVIKEVTFVNNRNTILLHGDNTYSSVLCDMKLNQTEEIKKLKQGQKIKIKGVCKGFLKDAILLYCMLINTQINE